MPRLAGAVATNPPRALIPNKPNERKSPNGIAISPSATTVEGTLYAPTHFPTFPQCGHEAETREMNTNCHGTLSSAPTVSLLTHRRGHQTTSGAVTQYTGLRHFLPKHRLRQESKPLVTEQVTPRKYRPSHALGLITYRSLSTFRSISRSSDGVRGLADPAKPVPTVSPRTMRRSRVRLHASVVCIGARAICASRD
jgi:hypothetical protein